MKVIVVGCHGQMGQPICRFVDEREGMELVGGVGPVGRDYIGRDLGQVAGLGRDLGIPVVDDLASIIDECDALIDVSSVEQCLQTLDLAVGAREGPRHRQHRLHARAVRALRGGGRGIPVIFKCNTSKMVNVMLSSWRRPPRPRGRVATSRSSTSTTATSWTRPAAPPSSSAT